MSHNQAYAVVLLLAFIAGTMVTLASNMVQLASAVDAGSFSLARIAGYQSVIASPRQ